MISPRLIFVRFSLIWHTHNIIFCYKIGGGAKIVTKANASAPLCLIDNGFELVNGEFDISTIIFIGEIYWPEACFRLSVDYQQITLLVLG